MENPDPVGPRGLYDKLTLAQCRLANRVAVSPMCQYSAASGCASDWHMVHIGYLCASGAGLVMMESTAVAPEGRITKSCLGLYSDENQQALSRLIALCRNVGNAAIGLQLGHAGRKGALQEPSAGGAPLPGGQGWDLIAPSEIAYSSAHAIPRQATLEDMKTLTAAYKNAASRAVEVGFDVLEIHAAHGYLLHSFLSPISNHRTDSYGGTLINRLQFPLDIVKATRSVWPRHRALGVRISGDDWVDGGAGIEDAIEFARALVECGCDYVTVSSGGIVPDVKIPLGRGYQVPLARAVAEAVDISVGAVGMILDPDQADNLLRDSPIDLVFVGRGFLDDPHFLWRAPRLPSYGIHIPAQYQSVTPGKWPPVQAMSSAPYRKEH